MRHLDQIRNYTAYICYFFILTFCFVFNSSQSFFFNFNSTFIMRWTYFAILALFLILTIPLNFSDVKNTISLKKEHIFLLILSLASSVLLYCLFFNRSQIQATLLYLAIFLSSQFIVRNFNFFIHITGISFSICALYSMIGIFCSNMGLYYGFLPILPSVYDGSGQFIGYGFYNGFAHSLYLQTNAAGAIFGYATCLFGLFYSQKKDRILLVYMALSAMGLILTKALAPLLITAGLIFIATNFSFKKKLAFSCLSLLIATPILANTIAQKINYSFFFKLNLLKENLALIFLENRHLIFSPRIANFEHTENSFIDLCFQYGFLLSALFYAASFLLVLKFVPFKRSNLLVLFPFFLSFFQNSTFSPPIMLSFTLACLFLIYFCNSEQKALQPEPQ